MVNTLSIGASRSRFSECVMPKESDPNHVPRKDFEKPPKEEVAENDKNKKVPRPVPDSFIDVEFLPCDESINKTILAGSTPPFAR